MKELSLNCKIISEEFVRPVPVLPLGAPVTGPVDQHYLPLKYFNNVTLLNLDAQETSEDSLRQILLQVGLGLDFLHSQNILHRNVHGNGIIVNPRNQVEIKNLENAVYGPVADGFYGSGYAPPEILWLRNFNIIPLYSFHDDVYSLGVVIFIFIYGDFPYTVNGHVVFPLMPINEKLRHLLESLLHRDRRSRLSDIKHFLEHSFFQREKKNPAVTVVNDSSRKESVPVCVEKMVQHSSEEDVPLCAQETNQHSSEDSIPLCAKQTEQPVASKSHYTDDKVKLSKKRRCKNPIRKLMERKPAATKQTANSTQAAVKIKEKKRKFKSEDPNSDRPLTSPEVAEDGRDEKPKKKKKSFFNRLVGRMCFWKGGKVEKEKLVVEGKVDGTSVDELKKTDVQTESQYLQEERKDFVYIATVKPKYQDTLQQQKEIDSNNMAKIEKQRESQPKVSSISSSYATSSSSSKGPQKIVKMLKDMKLQEQGQKLAPVIETDETSHISTGKPALPSSAEVAKPKKQIPFQKIPSGHKFKVTFEEAPETAKFANELFDPFQIEKKLTETKASPWLTEGQELKTIEENMCDSHLDAFQAQKNWFSSTLSEQHSVNTFAVWGNADDVAWNLNEKNDNSNNFFSDDFSENQYNIESESRKDENNDENNISVKPVEKKKKHFKWLRNLFSKKK